MSRSLLGLARTLPRPQHALYGRSRALLRAVSSAAPHKADNVQSLIREKLNGVTSALADITAHADWTSIETEIKNLKGGLQVRLNNGNVPTLISRYLQG